MGPNKHVVQVADLAARTAAASWTFNTPCLGGFFVVRATAASLTPSVTFTITGSDPFGATWTILVSAAVTGIGTTVLRVHPELTAAANTIAKDMLPSTVTVSAAVGDTDPLTYSVSFIGTN
jgi:hypothetical protein